MNEKIGKNACNNFFPLHVPQGVSLEDEKKVPFIKLHDELI